MSLVENVLNLWMSNQNKKNIPFDNNNGTISITGTHNAGMSRISEEEALSISSVLAATDLISSTIARLPIQIYQIGEKGEYIILDEDKRNFILNQEPNNLFNGIALKKRIVLDYLFHGNSYIIPEWNRNELLSLHHVPPKRVNIKKFVRPDAPYITDGLIEVLGANGSVAGEFSPDELVIILKNSEDGLQSKGVLEINGELFELAMRQQKYSTSILENGSLPLAVLTVTNKLSERALMNIKNSWSSNYTGSGNVGKTVVLEEGMDYKPVSLNPNELDLTSTKKATLADIARVFGLPESMINADANKYNSNEQNNIYFLQYTLSPIISAIEVALEKSLLLENEKKQGYHIRFDTSSILATTEKEKVESTVQALKGGLISMNEARNRHNLEEIDDDYMMLSLGSIFYNKDSGTMTIPNMGIVIDPNDPNSMAEAQSKMSANGGKPNKNDNANEVET